MAFGSLDLTRPEADDVRQVNQLQAKQGVKCQAKLPEVRPSLRVLGTYNVLPVKLEPFTILLKGTTAQSSDIASMQYSCGLRPLAALIRHSSLVFKSIKALFEDCPRWNMCGQCLEGFEPEWHREYLLILLGSGFRKFGFDTSGS